MFFFIKECMKLASYFHFTLSLTSRIVSKTRIFKKVQRYMKKKKPTYLHSVIFLARNGSIAEIVEELEQENR